MICAHMPEPLCKLSSLTPFLPALPGTEQGLGRPVTAEGPAVVHYLTAPRNPKQSMTTLRQRLTEVWGKKRD